MNHFKPSTFHFLFVSLGIALLIVLATSAVLWLLGLPLDLDRLEAYALGFTLVCMVARFPKREDAIIVTPAYIRGTHRAHGTVTIPLSRIDWNKTRARNIWHTLGLADPVIVSLDGRRLPLSRLYFNDTVVEQILAIASNRERLPVKK